MAYGTVKVDSIVTSTKTVTVDNVAVKGAIVNADINASAAIAYAKLALTNGIVNADISSSAAIAYAKLALTNGIVNADINASAAIADSKLATISTAGKVSNSATTATSANTASAIVARDASGNFTAGAITATGTISDASGNLRTLPQNSQTSSYTLAASDTGKHISITTGGISVPADAFSIGNVTTIFNNSSSSQTITQLSGVTLRKAGSADTGNRTLDQYGIATILCVASNTFAISGVGLN
jgi:hypothetical protein